MRFRVGLAKSQLDSPRYFQGNESLFSDSSTLTSTSQYPIVNWAGDSSVSCSNSTLPNFRDPKSFFLGISLIFISLAKSLAKLPLSQSAPWTWLQKLRFLFPPDVVISLQLLELHWLKWSWRIWSEPWRKPQHQEVPFHLPESGILPVYRIWSAVCELLSPCRKPWL